MFNVVPLYGGAITTVIPTGFLDASLLRSVPDTQEVYVNTRRPEQEEVREESNTTTTNATGNDGLGFNESIIVDLLQRVESDDDRRALEIHLNELDSLNESRGYRVVKYETVKCFSGTTAQACVTVQSANKWGDIKQRETVLCCVGLIRLVDVATDVLITVNVPLTKEEEREEEEEKEKIAGTAPDSTGIPKRVLAAYKLLLEMLQNFKVVDKSLFV